MNDRAPRITMPPLPEHLEKAYERRDATPFVPGSPQQQKWQQQKVQHIVHQLTNYTGTPDINLVDEALFLLDNDARPVAVLLADEWLTRHKLLSYALAEAWSAGHQPEGVLSALGWARLLEQAPYSVDGEPAEPPGEPLTLYRGCDPDDTVGMSWTSDPAVANKFASGDLPYNNPGNVYRFDRVPPGALRAHLTDRGESEYTLCPFWLREFAPEMRVLS